MSQRHRARPAHGRAAGRRHRSAWAWSATPSWAPPTPRAGAPSGRVFDLPLQPGAGRRLRARRRRRAGGGRPARLGGGRDRLARPDRPRRRPARRHLHPRRQPRRDRHRRAGGGQARAVREAARQLGRGGGGHGGGGRSEARDARPVGDGRLQLPPYARARARPPHGRRGPARARCGTCGSTLPPGLAGRPGVPADLAAAQGDGRLRRARRPRARTSSTSPSTWRASRWRGLRADRDVRTGTPAARRCRRPGRRRRRGAGRSPSTTPPCSPAASPPARSPPSRPPASRPAARTPCASSSTASSARSPSTWNASTSCPSTTTPDPAATAGFRRILVTEPDHPYLEAWWPPGHGLGYEHTFVHQARDLRRTPSPTGTEPEPSFADGLQVQRVLAAVEESAEKNCRLHARSPRPPDSRRGGSGGRDAHDRSRSSPASGPTCRWRRSAASPATSATTASNSPAGATTSRSTGPSTDPATSTGRHAAAGEVRPEVLGDLQPPRRPGRLRRPPSTSATRRILPARIWGDGEPEGVRQRAAAEMKDTARAAAAFGVDTVIGFTGSVDLAPGRDVPAGAPER